MSVNPQFLLEEDHDLPLCRIQIVLKTGATLDVGTQSSPLGLCHFATELMRRGAGGKTRAHFDESLDQLGASLQVLCGYDSVTFDLLVLKENLPKAFPLLADLVLRPNFEKKEADLLKREILAHLDELKEDDSHLASHHFSKALYDPHPYGNPVEGYPNDILNFQIDQVKAWYRTYIVLENILVGAAGDLSLSELIHLFETYFSSMQRGIAPALPKPPSPCPLSSYRIVLVDKPERTQSQILLGQMAPAWSDENYLPLHIATTAFGGTFTARLMDEVRVKRGLSYGASAYIGKGKDPQGLIVHVFPSAEQTRETLELVLSLYQSWAQGLRPDEINFAKSYLTKSYAFSIQTAESRLRRRIQLALCHMPNELIHTYKDRIIAVSETQVNQALTQVLTPDRLLITLVATASFMDKELKNIAPLRHAPLSVIPYDKDELR